MKETLMETARQAVRLGVRASIMGRPHGLVPMYHRIAEPSVDPWDIAVSPKHFAEHLEVLRDWARCRTFADFATALHGDEPEKRSVAITALAALAIATAAGAYRFKLGFQMGNAAANLATVNF